MKQDLGIIAGLLASCVLLLFIPGPKTLPRVQLDKVRVQVVSVDNSDLNLHGLVVYGSQTVEGKVLDSGKHHGKTVRLGNDLRGQLELDKKFQPGDVITAAIPADAENGTALEYDRSFWTWFLFAAFCILICVFGSWTGAKALFSFFFSCLVVWKAVIPLILHGWPASTVIFLSVALLTAAIIFLVAGFTRKGVTAFLGAMSGVLLGLLLAHLFSVLMKINGAVLPYSQALLYSGFETLNLQDLFSGAMILASSGAVMDLAMDIAAGAEEIVYHHPGLGRKELIKSCLRIGRSVVGTMTTTLLLAYSGGYITLLMMFSVQGNGLEEILNNPLVAAEVAKTLIGSFSLVLVAPLTALFAGVFYGKKAVSGENVETAD